MKCKIAPELFVFPLLRQTQMMMALLAICAVNSPHKGQWRGALVFSLLCAWINTWVNNRKAGNLRFHRAHYHVTVMWVAYSAAWITWRFTGICTATCPFDCFTPPPPLTHPHPPPTPTPPSTPQKMVAPWNSRIVKQSSDLKASSIPLRCHWSNYQQWSSLSLLAVLHQYSSFVRIPSAVANHYRKSASLLKRSVSITSISWPITLANVAFQSVPRIHAGWAILGDDVGAASRRLISLLKYRDRP